MTEILPLLLCLQPTLGATMTRRMAVILTAMLTMTGRVTMLGISRWSEAKGSYSNIQRFFYASIPWLTLSWLFFRVYLWEAGAIYLLAGDETVVTKSGKQTFGLDRVFSSLYQQAVPGVALWVWALVSVRQRQSYPLLAAPVVRSAAEKAEAATRTQARKAAQKAAGERRKAALKKQTRQPKKKAAATPQSGKKRGRPPGSKAQRGVDAELNAEMQRINGWLKLLLEVVREVLEVRYVVLDGHFGNAGGYALARGQGLEIISKLRSDAALYEHYEGEQKEQGRPRQYGSQIDYKQLPANCVVSSGEEDGYLVERSHLRGVWQKKFGVRLNVLVLVATRLKDGRRSNVVLFSSDLELGWEKLEEYYRLRFQIEFNFREAKQHWGLEDWMNTSESGLRNGVGLSFFQVLLSAQLLGGRGHCEKRVLDLKLRYLGRKYALETLKIVGEKAEGIEKAAVCAAVSRVGLIHQEIAVALAA